MTKDEITQWHDAHPHGARDEAYIDAVLARVKKLWLTRPQLRLGQLLANEAPRLGDDPGDPFYMLDESIGD